MHPANREKDAGHSGTGIYYQAVPAVGADGKNIMKLIPVQMVNGQFFQTDISKPRMDSTAQEGVTMNIASEPVQLVKKAVLNPFASQQISRKQVSSMSRPLELDHGYSLNKHSVQKHTANLTAKVPPIATPATNCGKSVRRPCRLPVMVKSPALPKGHHILIPPNAQVQTVPASDLPAGIKKHICISSGDSSPGSSLQSVVYVSPVTTVNQSATQTTNSVADSLMLLSETPNEILCGSQSKGSKPYLKLIPKVSQRPNSPIKWVIEEEDSSTAPDLNSLNSSSVTSEILRAMAGGETPSKHCDVIENTTSQSILSKSGHIQENALVMCNGKVFFLAKKCNLPFKMGQSDPPKSATKSYEFNRTTAPSAQQSCEPDVAQTQQDFRITIPDDVIDLCDDDDSTQQETSVDEDNVIFVSYIPPKVGSASPRNVMLKSQMELGKEAVKMGTSCSDSLIDEKHGRTGLNNDRDEGSALRGMLVSKRVCDSAVMNMHEDSNMKSQQGTSIQQVESMEVDAETENLTAPSTSHSCSGRYSEKDKDTHNMESAPDPVTCWMSSLAPKPCWSDDHLLKKMFGITADVNICLQRIDETSSLSVIAKPLQINKSINSVEDQQEPTNRKRETDNNSGFIKRVKLQNESEFSADSATPTPHTDVTLQIKCHSGQNSLCRPSRDDEAAPVIGYVEPIDEDFLSTNEDDTPTSKACVDLSTNTRRIGRTRKRTTCPCCTTRILDHTVKSSARLEEPEKWAWMTEQMRKKGQTKTGKDGKTSGKISCLTAKSKKYKTYEFPASDSLDTTSTDFDELKYDEQIKKLKELLRKRRL